MKNENINKPEQTGKNPPRKLDSLTEEQLTKVMEMAENSRMIDVVDALKEFKIDVSVATLSRYLKRHREKELLNDRAEMQPTLTALAESGETGTLRKGTLEAVRQRLYDRVLASDDPTEALAMYNSMLKEESKLRELDIQARKVAVAEEQVRLQALKLKTPTPATVIESSVIEPPALPAITDREQKLEQLLRQVTQTLNGPGLSEEKVLNARHQLAQESKSS